MIAQAAKAGGTTGAELAQIPISEKEVCDLGRFDLYNKYQEYPNSFGVN